MPARPLSVLFSTFLFTAFRELEVVHLDRTNVNATLNTVRVATKPDLESSPKRREEREVPVAKALIELLAAHPRRANCRFAFPSPAGNREWHSLISHLLTNAPKTAMIQPKEKASV
jgi:integrase